ncbi:NAD(P)/FAD-dependent oxidoreductase [Sphingomonas montanisoli]|uniref:Monooxygenase n=1 Tax=Sphingomonas montanisoli TaxID=2606412 RepID=A0A5D9C8C0_9SPHN|nr:FAD-dependent monooxygenase [Sphingomonas montanisoli]TZG27603.1 monooxygenase [Sphingomonas montanisoli]
MRRAPALIAGGGPAGATAAILLAHGGAMPVLIERARGPQDVVCGGFLAGDAIRLLGRLGIDPAALGAPAIHNVRLIARGQVAETGLPFVAAGLSRCTLDAALLDRAIAEGACVERGVAIRRVDGRCLHLADGHAIEGEALFLATGKHDVRGSMRPTEALDADPALGLRVRLEPTPALRAALDGMIELHLFDHGYAGLLLQEDGGANLCLSVAQSRVREAGSPDRLLAALAEEAPLLGERIGAAVGLSGWASIARIPYGWRAHETETGLFRLGDQAAVIASLAGDGVAIALASAMRAVNCFLHNGPEGATEWQAGFARRAERPVVAASLLRRMGEMPMLAGPLVGLLRHVPALTRLASAVTRIE